MAAFYGVQPSPVDDSIWGQSMDVGFSRIDQPGYIIRLVPGANPSETALAEVYLPPDERLRLARHRCRPQRRGVDGAVERPCRELRPPQVQGTAQRARCRHRQAVPGRLDALSHARGRNSKASPTQGQRQSRLLHLGRPLQHAGPRRERADRLDQWRRIAAGPGRRQVRRPARALSAWASSPRTSTAASTIRTPAGRAGASGPPSARAPCSTAKAARRATRSFQGADAPRSAGALSGGTRYTTPFAAQALAARLRGPSAAPAQ